MSLVSTIANKSIKDALATLAGEIDTLKSSPAQDVSGIQGDLASLKADVKAIRDEIFGVPDVEDGGSAPVNPNIDV